jgi:serine/threonine protein kinase
MIAGRYRLGTVVGRGGMGRVWQARDKLLDRHVAVKELLWPAGASVADRQAACRRATREAQVAGRLSHRNIIRVYDIVAGDDGRPWIVMELLPSQTLHDLVKRDGPLGPAQAAQVGIDVLAALRAAHAAGIVHRDVKPSNIMLDTDRVVLADFGIARALENLEAGAADMLAGSPSYIAPERALGGQSGPPEDLWGLGASLYAAVEGRGPFERKEGPLASLTATVADEPEPAVHAGPLAPVISGLLSKDPGQRLEAGETEELLRQAAAFPVGALVPRPRRPRVMDISLTRPEGAVVMLSGAAGSHEASACPGRHRAARRTTGFFRAVGRGGGHHAAA